ncbi:ADOP family duplicated permease [Planctomycetota bacterium]
MTTILNDIKFGLRILAKKPGFTAIALITLAIGIGANTIMFSVVNLLLFKPLHVQKPDRLVGCKADFMSRMPYEAYVELRNNNPAFSELVAQGRRLEFATLVWGDVTKHSPVMYVSSNYFSTLGVKPTRGRHFLPEEERLGAEPVTVLSHRLWQRHGADPEMVGKPLLLNGTFFRIVGVAPEGFTGASLIGPDLWLPLGSAGLIDRRGINYPTLHMVGRLLPGLSMRLAQAQLQPLIPHLKQAYAQRSESEGSFSLYALPRLSTDNGAEERAAISGFSLFLMGISAMVLLVACLNLANMLIIQGRARHREIAIRLALGGGRLCILRQLLVESLLLALLGGALGLVLAWGSTRLLNTWIAAGQSVEFPVELGAFLKIGLDLRVIVTTLGFSVLATLLFGLKPALRLSQRDVIADMKESGSGTVQTGRHMRRRWVPRGLSIVCQIALSVVLVMAATFFTRGAVNMAWCDYGYSLQGKLCLEVDPLSAGYDQAHSRQVYERLYTHLQSIPGVEAVGLSGGSGRGEFTLREYTSAVEEEAPGKYLAKFVNTGTVGLDYFTAMDIRLLQGRGFNRFDTVPHAERVVIINEHLAHKLRPDGRALDCWIQSNWKGRPSPPHRVVGIVPNTRTVPNRVKDNPFIFKPLASQGLPEKIHVRLAASQSERQFIETLTAEIHKIYPQLPILSVMSLRDRHRTNPGVWSIGLGARLALVFGGMTLFLASLGIYAVKGYMVASRTAEIGMRKALGATHRDIMGMVFREGLVLTLVGLALGLLLGFGMARIVVSQLHGVSATDPITIIVTLALLCIASLLASYIPARRAAKIDPMEALRYE